MIEWGYNQKNADLWRNSLEITNGRITSAIPCYRGRVNRRVNHGIATQTESACTWTSQEEALAHNIPTRRFASAMWFEVECDRDARLHLTMAADDLSRELTLSPEDILTREWPIFLEEVPFTTDGGTWGKMKSYAKFHVHRGWPVDQLTHHVRIEDKQPSTRAAGAQGGRGMGGGASLTPGQTDFYYVRVIQRNGQRAWSSPIWVEA